jgi:hypothetical protein
VPKFIAARFGNIAKKGFHMTQDIGAAFASSRDEMLVQRLLLNAINATQSDNFFSYFELFTSDAVWMMPSNRQDVSLSEAKRFYRFTDKFRFEQQVTIDEVQIFGQRGFARISFDGYLVAKRDLKSPPMRSIRDIWNNPREKD